MNPLLGGGGDDDSSMISSSSSNRASSLLDRIRAQRRREEEAAAASAAAAASNNNKDNGGRIINDPLRSNNGTGSVAHEHDTPFEDVEGFGIHHNVAASTTKAAAATPSQISIPIYGRLPTTDHPDASPNVYVSGGGVQDQWGICSLGTSYFWSSCWSPQMQPQTLQQQQDSAHLLLPSSSSPSSFNLQHTRSNPQHMRDLDLEEQQQALLREQLNSGEYSMVLYFQLFVLDVYRHFRMISGWGQILLLFVLVVLVWKLL